MRFRARNYRSARFTVFATNKDNLCLPFRLCGSILKGQLVLVGRRRVRRFTVYFVIFVTR